MDKENDDEILSYEEKNDNNAYFSYKNEAIDPYLVILKSDVHHPKRDVLLNINTNYSDFSTFYENEKRNIYLKYIDAFEKLINSNYVHTFFTVIYIIENEPVVTHFDAEKNNSDILIDVINPYFESIEDYEICGKITELYNNIKNS